MTGIRFWKDENETGTHVGQIWSSSGQSLTSVIFSGETTSGWQSQNLAPPLTINANTEYTVSVNCNGIGEQSIPPLQNLVAERTLLARY